MHASGTYVDLAIRGEHTATVQLSASVNQSSKKKRGARGGRKN
jgi:hypothetical protein